MPPLSNLRQRRRSVALALSKRLKLENPLLPFNTIFKGSPSAITLPWKDTSPRVSNAFNWSPAQPCSDTRSISFASITKSNANGAQAREPFVSRLPRWFTVACSANFSGSAPSRSMLSMVKLSGSTTIGATFVRVRSSKCSAASANFNLSILTAHGSPAFATADRLSSVDACSSGSGVK